MTDKKIIAVVGATGAQGGGLAQAMLNEPTSGFAVRALTRKVGSDKAKELEKLGAEVVEADLDDVESLKRAFTGAYGAFLLTNFWEHFSPEKEFAQAKNMAQAAKQSHLQHVIWSTLEDTRRWVPLSDNRMPTLMGKYKVPHFDAKGEADHLFADAQIPTTWLLTSFYWENLIYFGAGPKKGPDGKLAITFPMGDKKLPGICRGGYRQGGVRDFQEGQGVHRKDRCHRRRTSHWSTDGCGAHEGVGPRGALQRRDAGGVSQLRFSRGGRSGQHVPVQARFSGSLLRTARSVRGPCAQPLAANV